MLGWWLYKKHRYRDTSTFLRKKLEQGHSKNTFIQIYVSKHISFLYNKKI